MIISHHILEGIAVLRTAVEVDCLAMIPKLIVSTVRPLRRYHKKSLLIAVLRKTMAIEVRKLPLSRTNEPIGEPGDGRRW
jgi:hypothetical protein